MELKHEYCSTMRFAFEFGFINCYKETVRLILRQIRYLSFNRLLVCRAAGKIVGYGAVIKCSKKYSFAEKGAYILAPYWVSVEHRKQNIGYSLVNRLAEDLGRAVVYAYICQTNAPSFAVMKKAGYEIVGRMKSTGGKYILMPIDDESHLVVVKHTGA